MTLTKKKWFAQQFFMKNTSLTTGLFQFSWCILSTKKLTSCSNNNKNIWVKIKDNYTLIKKIHINNNNNNNDNNDNNNNNNKIIIRIMINHLN